MLSLIKNKVKMPENEDIIFATTTLDYVITFNMNDKTIYCYGNKRTDLTNFLSPGIISKLSAETGEFIKNNENLKEVSELFELQDNKIYYILRLNNNDENLNNIFFFESLCDILNFTGTLQMLSLNIKTDFLKGKYDIVWLRIRIIWIWYCNHISDIEFKYQH